MERRAEVVSTLSLGSSEAQLGTVSSLAGFPPDGDGQMLTLSQHGAVQPLTYSMHTATCQCAWQLGYSPALLPCFRASHTLLPWLQAFKEHSPVRSIAVFPCLVWKRWSLDLKETLPFLQLIDLDVHCPVLFAGDQLQPQACFWVRVVCFCPCQGDVCSSASTLQAWLYATQSNVVLSPLVAQRKKVLSESAQLWTAVGCVMPQPCCWPNPSSTPTRILSFLALMSGPGLFPQLTPSRLPALPILRNLYTPSSSLSTPCGS